MAYFYPPIGITTSPAVISGRAYGNGQYVVSRSSAQAGSEEAVWAFNRSWTVDSINNWWTSSSSGGRYISATGISNNAAITSLSDGSSYMGEWIQIELPGPVAILQMLMYPRPNSGILMRNPSNFILAGSNDGTTFTSLLTVSGYNAWAVNTAAGFGFNTGLSAYNMYRVCVNSVQPGGDRASIAEIILFSSDMSPTPTPTPTPTATPTPTPTPTLLSLRFPPVALTGNTNAVTGQAYGNGTYTVSSSSQINNEFDWGAFNFVTNIWTPGSKNYWTSGSTATTRYSASGLYPSNGSSSTVVDGNTCLGEWVQIQMPISVRIGQVYMWSRGGDATALARAPKSFIIAGSNDGVTWSAVFTENNRTAWASGVPYVMLLPAAVAYSYYRVIVLSTCGADLANIAEIALYAPDLLSIPPTPTVTPTPTPTPTPLPTPLYTYPLDNVSAIGASGLVGAYSVVRLSSTYTGPTVNLRRSTDNVTSNFYADVSGNLTSAINGGGTTLSAWLGGATAYVATWYDQSPNGFHATQTTPALQPIMPTTGGIMDFKQNNTYLNLPDGTVPTGSTPFTITCKHGVINNNNSNGPGGTIISGGTNNNLEYNVLCRFNNNYNNIWWSNDSQFSSYGVGNTVTIMYDAAATYKSFINGTMIQNATRTGKNTSAVNNRIGSAPTSALSSLQGELYYIYIFKTDLSTADRTIVERY